MKFQKHLMILFLASLCVACGNSQQESSTQKAAEDNAGTQEEKPQATLEQVSKLAIKNAQKVADKYRPTLSNNWELVDETIQKAQQAFDAKEYKQAQVLAVQAQKLAEQALSRIPEKDTEQ
ncbi:hypothetical protein [Marinicella sp. W31]|uniref:hypothetical protein n=1 Tax=Marinicella sp. W31 TaxID=3023713 RepID=UPI0037580978